MFIILANIILYFIIETAMDRPFFSVIIPTYNRAGFLKIAAQSVLSQSFDDFELIIVDDGSSDETKNTISSFPDKRIRYIHQPHRGVSSSRNNGVKEARGEFICFLDSDDRFVQRKLEIAKEYIEKHPEYKIFHTEEIWYRNGKILGQKIYHKKPTGWVFNNAVTICCIGISTSAVHKSIFKDIGLFDETMPACEDYDFWLRTAAKYPFYLINKSLTIKEGGHFDQQSKKYEAMDRFRIYALKKIIESGKLSRKNHEIAALELKKKCQIYIHGAEKRGKTSEANYYRELTSKVNSKYENRPLI
ncbi:MAG: glycosyltransferase [Candidatus Omnitrophota bacterium]